MAKMRVTIRYSLDKDTDDRLRRYVEGRLNIISPPPNKVGTGAFETHIPMTSLKAFGLQLGEIFKHLEGQAVAPACLDHFWMHCDVIADATPLASPASAARP